MNKKKILRIIIPSVAAFLAVAAGVFLYLYYFYYHKPNFVSGSANSISAANTDDVAPGDEIDYIINFKNTGNTDVTALKITTKIPDNTRYLSSNPQAKIDSESKKMEFLVPLVAKNTSGSVTFKIKANSPLDNGMEIKTGEISFNYTARKEMRDFLIGDIISKKVASSPDFSGFKMKVKDLNGGQISMGDKLQFDISLSNSGNMNAKNIKVINILPDKLLLDKKTIKPDAQVEKSSENKESITWELSILNAGQNQDFSFTATVGNNFGHLEEFTDSASVEYGTKTVSEASVSEKVWGFPDFSKSENKVADIDGGSVWAGDILEYTVVIKNTGLRAGQDFKLICPIPELTSFVTGSESGPDSANYDSETKTLLWEIKSLDVNQEISLKFSSKISGSLIKGGKISTGFYIEGDGQDVQIEPVSINVRAFIFQTLVCMGDSQITFTNWPASLDYLLESGYVHAEFNTIGSGVPQQMAYQGVKRFDSTVAVYKPSIIVFGYGTNDAGVSTSLFRNGMTELIQKAKAIGATPVVHSIGWIDTGQQPLKKSYTEYNAILRDVCAANGVPYVDIYGPMSQDPGRYVSSEGMHWTADGGALVANLVYNTIRNYLDGEGNRK